MKLTLYDEEAEQFVTEYQDLRRQFAALRVRAERTAERLHRAVHEIEKLAKPHHNHKNDKEK